MRAAIYTRISLDRQGKRAGVERQLDDCRALCRSRRWKVVGTFEDNDRSAYSGRARPEYQALVAAVAGGDVDVVVAAHSDRLWRSVVEQQAFLGIARDAGLRLVATPGQDFDPASADDEFMSTIQAAIARRESAGTARRMARRQLEKAQRGEFHGGARAFGHTKDRSRVVAREADAIRDAAQRVLAGESFRSVMLDWNKRGIRTPRGNEWRHDTFTSLLRQARLAGLREHHGEVVGPATWPAILDTETHEQLARIIDGRRRGPKGRPARKHLLTGFIRCHCGARMVASPNERGVTRYVCPPRGNGKGNACTSIVGHHAHDAATDLVLDYLDSADFKRAITRAQRAASSADRSATTVRGKLAKDRARLATLGESFADGELDRPEYRRLSARVQQRIDEAERQLDRVDGMAPSARWRGQGAVLREAWEHMTLDERREVLGAVVDHFVVRPAVRPVNVFRPDRVELVPRFP